MLTRLYNLRYWLSWIVLAAAAAAVIYWGFVSSADPRTVRLAVTADEAWQNEFGDALKRNVERQTDYRVQVFRTSSPDGGRSRVLDGAADLAVAQVGSVEMRNLTAVAPLWDEYVQILVRPDSGIDGIRDLAGRSVSLGREDSANRASARRVLGYYGIDTDDLDRADTPLTAIADDADIDAAVVTSGLNDPDLREVIAGGEFELLPLSGVEGFSFNHRHYRASTIPAGVYPTTGMPVPPAAMTSPSVDAILVARPDLHPATVETLLPVLDSVDMRADIPDLVDRNPLEDRVWQLLPRHEATVSYFADRDRFGASADGLAGIVVERAEWIVLLLLLIGLAVYQWRRQRIQTRESTTHGVKRELERLFQEVFRLEGAQREARDVRVLQEYLNELNQIKMKALKRALGTPAGDSSLFLAFLEQTRSVSQQIEWRLSMAATTPSPRESTRRAS